LPHITANDNRTPAGVLKGGVLTLRLVAQDGLFFPDGENGSSIVLQAFGEEDKAPSSSAPLIRVPAGTEVRVTVRTGLAKPLARRHRASSSSSRRYRARIFTGVAPRRLGRVSAPERTANCSARSSSIRPRARGIR
jgi:hypothetical protein